MKNERLNNNIKNGEKGEDKHLMPSTYPIITNWKTKKSKNPSLFSQTWKKKILKKYWREIFIIFRNSK